MESVVAILMLMALPCTAMIVYDVYKGGRSDTREIIAYFFFGMWVLGVIGHIILMMVK